MPIATIPMTAFSGGEWSPRLHGRVDIAKYSTACEVLQNMVLYPHGGITRRMGLEYIEDAKATQVRLIPFEYNREQAYVLEFGPTSIRFFRNGAQVISGLVPLEIASPYLASEIDAISYTQSADTLYLVHENHQPRKLVRTGADVFALQTITAIPNTSASDATPAWGVNNWPRAITFYQNRLVYGGTSKKPQTVYLSKPFLFEDFTLGTASNNDALIFTLSSNQVNAIQWLLSGHKLVIGTTGGEWTMHGEGGISSTNVQVKRESNFGSKTGKAQMVGTEIVYASRDGKKLRGMSYSYENEGFISPELSLLSEHLTRPGIKEFDFAQNPDGILWTVFNDGTFAGFTFLKSQEVQGWHRHQTQGTVKSVCTIETDDGSEVWLAVNRNGATRIERMKRAFEGTSLNDTECAYVDSYLTYNGPAVKTFTGIEHLEGMTVSILADGQHMPDQVVAGGSVTLDIAVSRVVVGLPYEWRVVPLRLEGGSPGGFAQGKRKRIESLIVRLERTAGISHKLPGATNATPLPLRNFGDNFNAPVPLYSGDIQVKLNNSWDREGQFELSGKTPLPVTILMIAAKVTVNE